MKVEKEPRSITSAILLLGICIFVLLAGVAAVVLRRDTVRDRPLSPIRPAVEELQPPSLYCIFFDFTHASIVVGFEFVVDLPVGAPPRFAEHAEAVRDDPAIDFDKSHRPNWSYAIDDNGTQTIASPDGATRIMLYGLKLGTGGTFWTEAGIRSNTFRNLDGKCLQSRFENVGRSGVLGLTHPR